VTTHKRVSFCKLRIFISYRREETAPYAGRIYDSVIRRFGQEGVFMDIDTIHPGSDFTEMIASALDSCDVLLAIIGPTWETRTVAMARGDWTTRRTLSEWNCRQP